MSLLFVTHCLGDVALQQCLLGMEFSGRDPEGKRVMGLVPAKGLATSVDVDKRFLWNVPSNWLVSNFQRDRKGAGGDECNNNKPCV